MPYHCEGGVELKYHRIAEQGILMGEVGDPVAITQHLLEVASDEANRSESNPIDIRYQDFRLPNPFHPSVQEVFDYITDQVQDFFDGAQLECCPLWTIVNKPGDQIYPHWHVIGDNEYSVVYWAQTPPGSGELEFYPWGFAPNKPTKPIQPVAGRFIVFKGDTLHGVRHNTSKEDRVSMSFNITVGGGA